MLRPAQTKDTGERLTIDNEGFSHTPMGKDSALPNCSKLVEKHDDTKCQFWRDEVESFMVFVSPLRVDQYLPAEYYLTRLVSSLLSSQRSSWNLTNG